MTHRIALALALTLLAACGPELAPDLQEVSVATYPIVDGSPDAVGLLDLVNDPTTTVAILDFDAALDSRAATNLIARRDSIGDFTSIAQVDEVRWVGNSAINKLVAFAASQGRVPGPTEVLGTWDGVEFTVEQAELLLEIVINDLAHHDFDIYIGLDRRAADSIVAAQPVESVAVLAGLYYVGHSALNKLKDEAEEMMGDEWPSCVPTLTPVVNPAADDLNTLLELATTVDQPWAEVLTFQADGCTEWWTDEDTLNETIWNATFYIDWSEFPADYRTVTPWSAGGSTFTSALDLSLVVIDEHIEDGDFDPTSGPGAALYTDRFNLVETLSADLDSNPGAYLNRWVELDMSECSEEAAILLDTRDSTISVVHENAHC